MAQNDSNIDIEKIEGKSLFIGAVVNILMALAGWYTFFITNSEALLLDGNFSFIAGISTFVAVIIVNKRHKKTKIFPFGRYFYESLFVFFKGVMILGITIGAFTQNIVKVIDYSNGEPFEKLNAGPILLYSILMGVLCFSLSFYFKRSNKRISNQSSILEVESKTSFVDGFLSLSVGLALILTTLVPETSSWSFLLFIGDALVVILLCLYMFQIPVKVIKNALIELGGGVLQEESLRQSMLNEAQAYLPDWMSLKEEYISKLGSSYFVVLYIQPHKETFSVHEIDAVRDAIYNDFVQKYRNVQVELILSKNL